MRRQATVGDQLDVLCFEIKQPSEAAMPKIDREHSTPRFSVRKDTRTGKFVLENRKTGKRLPLKGYGTLKESLFLKDSDVDLTQPIYAQIMSAKVRAKSRIRRPSSRGTSRK